MGNGGMALSLYSSQIIIILSKKNILFSIVFDLFIESKGTKQNCIFSHAKCQAQRMWSLFEGK